MAKIEIITKIPKNVELDKLEISQIINTSLNQLQANNDIIIEVGFFESKKMKGLNLQYRDIANPTDVLSFPQKIFNQLPNQILGSIIICPKMVKIKNEKISNVIKHGLLHLLDYDHENNKAVWNKAAKTINCGL
jgi:probable rRNA maturation factor